MLISPRNPITLNLGLLQQSDVSALLYADSLRSIAKGLQKFDPSMVCKQIPTMAELFKAQSPGYPFESSWLNVKDQICLILHSSGSTGMCIRNLISRPTMLIQDAQDPLNWCISHMPPYHVQIMILKCLSQRAGKRKMQASSVLILRLDFTHVSRHIM